MRVQDELQRTARLKFAEGRVNLLGERRKLIVNDEQSVGAGRYANIATLAFEHVHVACDMCAFDLNVFKGTLRQQRDRG